MPQNDIIKKVYGISLSDLRSCRTKEGILASHVNFSDYWARDTFWAALGMLETENPEEIAQVKKSFRLFLRYQRADGKIPRKIALDYNGLKYLGLKIKRRKPRPIYTSPLPFLYSTDNDLLFVLSFCKYHKIAGDDGFVRDNFQKIEQSLGFYASADLIRGNLIHENGLANWMDSIFKNGFVLYTNCLWYESVRQFEILCEKLNIKSKSKDIPASKEILDRIQKIFWLEDEKYFSDNIAGGKPQKYFDLAGNLLAIFFDIANWKRSELIFSKIKQIRNGNVLHPINAPLYPFWKINPLTRLFGIARYHNGISWSWLEALLVIAECKTGKISEARADLENLSEIIAKNGHIHETYFPDGRPFDHALWKSAVPFAWGAGLFLWAVSLLENKD
ncbi:MAG: amylo-alpha-1,6-glucosidase [Parcubacteria group bacterium]|jgi:glycogen debranching enzyme